MAVRVHIGPVSTRSAKAWFDYAEHVIARLREIGADRAPPEALDDRARLLLRGVPRRKRKMLEGTAQVCASMPPVEPGTLVHWLHQTAGRLAAVVADDLIGVVGVIRRTDELGSVIGAELLARSPVVNDLLRMWMSEPAMVVRRRVGLVPGAA